MNPLNMSMHLHNSECIKINISDGTSLMLQSYDKHLVCHVIYFRLFQVVAPEIIPKI